MEMSQFVICLFVILNVRRGRGLRQRDMDISDMANCKFENNICNRTEHCKVDLWFQPDYLFVEDCTDTRLASKFILCDQCWLDFGKTSVKVTMKGVKSKLKQLQFQEIIRYSIKRWCPKIGCNIVKFKGWSEAMTTEEFFLNITRDDVIYMNRYDIKEQSQTELAIVRKVQRKTALGAVHPDDIFRVLQQNEVQQLLMENNIFIQRNSSDDYFHFGDNSNNERDDGLQTMDSSNRERARIPVLIVFGVILFFVLLALILIRRRACYCNNSQTTESIETEDDSEDDDVISEHLQGIDRFIRPPPYTLEDDYRKVNSPPSYTDIIS